VKNAITMQSMASRRASVWHPHGAVANFLRAMSKVTSGRIDQKGWSTGVACRSSPWKHHFFAFPPFAFPPAVPPASAAAALSAAFRAAFSSRAALSLQAYVWWAAGVDEEKEVWAHASGEGEIVTRQTKQQHERSQPPPTGTT
jgi:hypothetical protein